MGMGQWLGLGSVVVVLAVLAACHISTTGADDNDPINALKKAGAACTQSVECQSENCISNVCTGRECGTSTPEPQNCEPGWSCVHHDSECTLNVFCSSAGYTCIATCGEGCPTGTYCADPTEPASECSYGQAPPPALPAGATVTISAENYAHPGDNVTFTSNVSAPTGVTITSTAWDFGDGATATGANATHVFATLGTYNVKVTITDSYNRTESTEQPIGICLAPGATCAQDGDCCGAPEIVCNPSHSCATPF